METTNKQNQVKEQNLPQNENKDEYITVQKNPSLVSGKSSNISEKLKSLKSLISFNSTKSSVEFSDSSKQNASNNTQGNQQEQQQPPTCLKKIENKVIETVEVEKSIKVFMIVMAIGSGMICLSIFFLPLIITKPSAFSMTFGFGSLLLLVSFLFYHGTKVYFQKLFAKDRFWISIVFLLSICFGIGFSIKKHYIICLICSIVQLLSLFFFLMSFIPGGKCGIDCIKNLIKSPFTKVWVKMAENQIENS